MSAKSAWRRGRYFGQAVLLLEAHGPGDMHDTLTSQFQRRAQEQGVYVSELVTGRIVAYWVNFWVRLMRKTNYPSASDSPTNRKQRAIAAPLAAAPSKPTPTPTAPTP